MFQRRFQWVSNVFERSSEKFQESSNVFKESFKSAQKRYQGATRKFQGCCKNISRVFLRRLKGVSRQSQRHSKEVSRVFKESVKCVLRNFKQKVSRVFQNVSIKFCFAILFLHESHRSYPSKRRACFLMENRVIEDPLSQLNGNSIIIFIFFEPVPILFFVQIIAMYNCVMSFTQSLLSQMF